jgi:ubiquinone/menaquinone biosynthesis C-methylase UbiE
VRPQRTHLEVLRSELRLPGSTIVDVGCGAGGLTRRLASDGARTVGVDPSVAAIARASGGAGAGERYLVGRAEELPLPDRYADAVTFLNSLHHVSTAALPQALAEARRVLRADGVVYVQEPLAEGRYFELVRLIDDETEVRAAAQQALREAQGRGLELVTELEYEAPIHLSDFDAFKKRMVLTDSKRAQLLETRATEIEQRFYASGRRDRDGWSFLQPTRVIVLRRRPENTSGTAE